MRTASHEPFQVASEDFLPRSTSLTLSSPPIAGYAQAVHISVCICTFQRATLLDYLLRALATQVVTSAFTFDIVVVDNDSCRSAESVVLEFMQWSTIDVFYELESERNIALARNRAIRVAQGTLIAFLDDDEYPTGDWLLRLYTTLTQTGASGVLGPVVPVFPPGAPSWLKQGDFFYRRRMPTGELISRKDLRSGNVLFRKTIVTDDGIWFNPDRGTTGGEDGEFFTSQIQTGRSFVWCDEAVAYETVLPERWLPSFHLRKYLRIGTIAGEQHRRNRQVVPVCRSAAKVLCYAAALPLVAFAGKCTTMQLLISLSYDMGCITAYCGLSLLRSRSEFASVNAHT